MKLHYGMNHLLRHPLPDELVTSFLARSYELLGGRSWRDFLLSAFGNSSVVDVIDLPAHLEALASRFPSGGTCTAQYLAEEHTLYPYYAYCMAAEKRAGLLAAMKGVQGHTVHSIAGTLASQVKIVDRLRLCLDCISEDRLRFDAAYWHRSHQIPGVLMCPVHQRPLLETAYSTRRRLSRHEHVSAEKVVAAGKLAEYNLPQASRGRYLHLAQDSAWLLGAKVGCTGEGFLANVRLRLWQQGLALRNGRLRLGNLQKSFDERFPAEFLQTLGLSAPQNVGESWLLRLLRGTGRVHHPLMHLLVAHWLGGSIQDYAGPIIVASPFGAPPYPCLNKAADHYQKEVVVDVAVRDDGLVTSAPRGYFRCACGFHYSRVGPDKTARDRYRLDSVDIFGPVWNTRLTDLWRTSSVSLREIARQLGVDPLTVKRKATLLKLSFPRKGRRLTTSLGVSRPKGKQKSDSRLVIKMRRNEWLRLLATYPAYSTTQLRRHKPRVYTHLYRNDRVWLKAHARCVVRKGHSERVSTAKWKARDRLFSRSVKESATSLRTTAGRPRRLTITAMARVMGCYALIQRHGCRLPITMAAMARFSETREQYALRRIAMAVIALRVDNIPLTRWSLIKRSGVERLLGKPQITAAIKNAIVSQLA